MTGFTEKLHGQAAAKELQARQKAIKTRRPFYLNQKFLTSHLLYGHYVFYPLIAGGVWLGGILALLGLWVHNGKPIYKYDEPPVVYISDVGANYHTLFIIICCITAGFYILTMLAERWLRHVDRIPSGFRRREVAFDWLAIIFAILGSAGLVLLSIFDAFHHSTVHWSMTVVFVVCVALSAIFQTAEVWHLANDHPDRRHLMRNAVVKLGIVVVAIGAAIAFGITYGISHKGKQYNSSKFRRIGSVSAALEWAIAFWLTFYFLTLAADLWPSGKSSPRYMRRLAKWQQQHDPAPTDFNGRGAFEQHPDRWQDTTVQANPNAYHTAHHNQHQQLSPDDASSAAYPRQSMAASTAAGSEAGLVPPYPAGGHANAAYPAAAKGQGQGATYNAHHNRWNAPGAGHFQSNHHAQSHANTDAQGELASPTSPTLGRPIHTDPQQPAVANEHPLGHQQQHEGGHGQTFNAHIGTRNV